MLKVRHTGGQRRKGLNFNSGWKGINRSQVSIHLTDTTHLFELVL
jgi:hypothetical protein